ncbi:uncharacterized protein LOC124321119 isoform X1 [Daphnia pulicaria]|uniref:uncharacterized protein LOC124321119 isoform X1 n=2 Tax=Daphnia pulicaria TaxID=35523 RepID=UPI001EEAEAAB|nr:uncharacterized protein LOC124321119 isoform X1 [Daphnia pulicaria]
MKHAAIECLSLFQNSLSLNRSKHLLILGTGISGLYLVGQIYVSYKKAQRSFIIFTGRNGLLWRRIWLSFISLNGENSRPMFLRSPLKLETYLRMTGIPYENKFEEPMGLKGKTPWITLNGDKIADSQLCMELLARKFHKDCSSHLSPKEQAIVWSFHIMAEEHLYYFL